MFWTHFWNYVWKFALPPIGVFLFIFPAFNNPTGEFALGSFIYGVAAILYSAYTWWSEKKNSKNIVEVDDVVENIDS